jgi:hypothetical protein
MLSTRSMPLDHAPSMLSPAAAVPLKVVSVVDMSYDQLKPALAAALVHADLYRGVHADDGNNDAGGVDEKRGLACRGDQFVEEEVDGGDDLEEEAKRSRRPRPRKKSLDGEGGEFVNTPKRARSSAEKKEAISFAADRPTRDRKSIDRFIASAQKENTRELRIKQVTWDHWYC